jgi:hypothetical protein
VTALAGGCGGALFGGCVAGGRGVGSSSSSSFCVVVVVVVVMSLSSESTRIACNVSRSNHVVFRNFECQQQRYQQNTRWFNVVGSVVFVGKRSGAQLSQRRLQLKQFLKKKNEND